MNDSSFFVQILERLGNLGYDMSGKIFAEIGQADDLVEEFTAWTEFEDDEVILSRF